MYQPFTLCLCSISCYSSCSSHMVSLLLLEHISHAPSVLSLYCLFCLPEYLNCPLLLFLQVYSNVTFSMRPTLTKLFKLQPTPTPTLSARPFVQNVHSQLKYPIFQGNSPTPQCPLWTQKVLTLCSHLSTYHRGQSGCVYWSVFGPNASTMLGM